MQASQVYSEALVLNKMGYKKNKAVLQLLEHQ